jgi:predicted transcriptional regulator of viral defense system
MSSQRNHGQDGGGRDRQLAEIATEQGGVVSLDQLRKVGIARRNAAHRADAGRLHRIHRGVYAVGHRSLGQVEMLRAAVLACGEGSVVSTEPPRRSGACMIVGQASLM